MDPQLIPPISVGMGVVVWALAAKWWTVPALSGMPREQAALRLVLPHALRYIGLCFLVPGLPSQVLPKAFSLPAA